jgi:hypothetical protein
MQTDQAHRRVNWGQALILRDRRIVHMQDFTDPTKALKAARH